MTENIFYFGDMLFLQINGTAIETPCTIVYTNLYTDITIKIIIKTKLFIFNF